MESYAYIIKGWTQRRDSVGCCSTYAEGIKVGATNNIDVRFSQLKANGNFEVVALFKCEDKAAAEVFESICRLYFLDQPNASRNGNDWIEGIECDLNALLKCPLMKAALKEIRIQSLTAFNYPTVIPEYEIPLEQFM